jgi:threonine/homoserine/homoserine lactone efflux protein
MALAEALAAAPVAWGQAGTLLLTSLAIMGSPGPATISLTAAGSAYGVRRSAGYLAGIIAGTTAVLIAVATGITAALLALPALRAVLIVASAGYILWLAWHIATAPPGSAQARPEHSPSLAGGALLGIANPKAWIAIAAVFASAHLAASPATDAAAKTSALTLMIIVINSAWLIAGASLAPVLRDPRRSRVINVALAVALVAATALAVAHQL